MDTDPHQLLHETFVDLVERSANMDPASSEATTAIKNLESFSKLKPPAPAPVPEPAPVAPPEPTKWDRFKCGLSTVWDNETTRVLIKAGGSLVGVGAVVWTTIHKDHVIERNALNQANQRPI
jgi:hypothetical protein